jgi:hypothetical protein
MNLNSFLMGFFYGFACFASLGVIACLWVGYMEARGKLERHCGFCAVCGKEYVACRCPR